MSQFRLVFRVHAIQRMFQRGVSERKRSSKSSRSERPSETYPEDKPFPSRLVLGWSGFRPVHVVVADNVAGQEAIIITVYQPDAEEWEVGFKRRKR